MRKEVDEIQLRHNISLWHATLSQKLISGYIKGFTSDTTAQELLETRSFDAYVRTNKSPDFVWQAFAKRHILAAARNMGLYGRSYDGRWNHMELEPEDGQIEPDIIDNIEWQERYQAFKSACGNLEPMEREVMVYYCRGLSLTDMTRNYNLPYAKVYGAFRSGLNRIIQNLAEQGHDVITDTGAVLANIRTFSHSYHKRSRKRLALAVQ